MKRHKYFSDIYKYISDYSKDWILSNYSNRKGVIPNELIKNHNDLNILTRNDNDFFDIKNFYSSVINKTISQEDYEA